MPAAACFWRCKIHIFRQLHLNRDDKAALRAIASLTLEAYSDNKTF